MSPGHVEIVRKHTDAYNAFMRHELSSEAYAELFHPQIEMHWRDRQTYPDTPQHLSGAQELIAFTEQYRDGWTDLTIEALEIIDAPEGRLLILSRQSGQGRGSGVPIVIHFFQLWTLQGGKLRQIEYFRHRGDAFQAAGLSD